MLKSAFRCYFPENKNERSPIISHTIPDVSLYSDKTLDDCKSLGSQSVIDEVFSIN